MKHPDLDKKKWFNWKRGSFFNGKKKLGRERKKYSMASKNEKRKRRDDEESESESESESGSESYSSSSDQEDRRGKKKQVPQKKQKSDAGGKSVTFEKDLDKSLDKSLTKSSSSSSKKEKGKKNKKSKGSDSDSDSDSESEYVSNSDNERSGSGSGSASSESEGSRSESEDDDMSGSDNSEINTDDSSASEDESGSGSGSEESGSDSGSASEGSGSESGSEDEDGDGKNKKKTNGKGTKKNTEKGKGLESSSRDRKRKSEDGDGDSDPRKKGPSIKENVKKAGLAENRGVNAPNGDSQPPDTQEIVDMILEKMKHVVPPISICKDNVLYPMDPFTFHSLNQKIIERVVIENEKRNPENGETPNIPKDIKVHETVKSLAMGVTPQLHDHIKTQLNDLASRMDLLESKDEAVNLFKESTDALTKNIIYKIYELAAMADKSTKRHRGIKKEIKGMLEHILDPEEFIQVLRQHKIVN